MKRFLKWTAVVIGVVLVLAIGLFALSRGMGATDEQEHALALMSDRDAPAGTNAFAALWLMPYDVPAAQRSAIVAADVQRFHASLAPVVPGEGDAKEASAMEANADFVSAAQGRFERHPDSNADLPQACAGKPVECLQQVRAHVADYRRWRQANRMLIERAALDGADYYRNPFKPRLDRPIPAYTVGLRARRTSQALDFVVGDRNAAFAGACHDINIWRRLGANAGDLITTMVAFGTVSRSSQLFAAMLARSPADQVLPPVCETAFAAPLPQELSMCAAMKGEFVLARTANLQVRPALDSKRLLFDGHATDARIAQDMMEACEEATRLAIFEDRPLPPNVSHKQFDFSCIANAIGCILSNIAAPAYRDYLLRAQEAGVRMRLAATVYWLHTQTDGDRPVAQRLAARPAALRSPQHPIDVVDGGSALRIESLLGEQRDWQLPLAPTTL